MSHRLVHLHFIITGPGTVGISKSGRKASLNSSRSSDLLGESTQTNPMGEASQQILKIVDIYLLDHRSAHSWFTASI